MAEIFHAAYINCFDFTHIQAIIHMVANNFLLETCCKTFANFDLFRNKDFCYSRTLLKVFFDISTLQSFKIWVFHLLIETFPK